MIHQDELSCRGSLNGGECPVEMAIFAIGGKWKLLIIRVLLLEGPRRFNRLLESLGGVSSKVLTQNLRALAAGGLLERRVVCESPNQVEYALTPAGQELMPIFKALGDWRGGLSAAKVGPTQNDAPGQASA